MANNFSPQMIIKMMEASVFDLELSPAEKRLFTINYNKALTIEDECTGVEFTKGCPKCEAHLLEQEE